MAENALSSLKDLKPWQKIAVAAGGGGIALYVYLQHKKSASASTTAANASSSTPAMVTDPSSGESYPATGTDPETGLTYEAEIDQYGGVSAAESSFSGSGFVSAPLGNSAGVGSFNDGSTAIPYSYTSGTETGSNYPSNAAWSQAVEGGLSDLGYNSIDVGAALGRYLAGLSLSPDQAQIVQTALAEYGNPPAGNYAIITAPVQTPVTTGTTPATTPPPSSTPPPASKPSAPHEPSGVTITHVTPTSVSAKWNAVPGASHYNVRVTYESKLFTKTTSTNSVTVTGLRPNSSMTLHIAAVGAGGTSAETGNSFHTPK